MIEYFLEQGEFFARIVLASLCGAFIGYERMHRGKDAGIRTHFVVAAASALMMIISKYGFSDLSKIVVGSVTEYKLDPSRLAAQIVSGVGFLGAGMIYINRNTPHGLTTAAGIWATAGIGMAIGSGMYLIGLLTTLFIYIAQLVLHRKKFLKTKKEESFSVIIDGGQDAVSHLRTFFQENHIEIEKLSLKRLDNNTIKVDFSIIASSFFDKFKFLELVSENSFIKKVDPA